MRRVIASSFGKNIGAPLDLTVETFDRINGMDFWPMIFREAHKGEHIDFASSMKAASFGTFGFN
jgi:hypothetical protein